jgi:hypothetical protein
VAVRLDVDRALLAADHDDLLARLAIRLERRDLLPDLTIDLDCTS